MNKDLFKQELEKLNINVTEEQLKKLDIYANFLLEYNKHTNLTAIKDIDQVYLKHFYDSLTLVKSIDLTSINNMIDIGTGPGFPGMVIKIFFPHIKMTLLDSNNKKITFLKELNNLLKLENVNITNARAEEFCVNNRESYDLVTARAVSNMTVLTELCLPLTKIGGYFIALKGSDDNEITESEYAIKELGGQIESITNFKLPIEESTRNIVKIKKVNQTSKQYPRRYDKITKNPLKKKGK